MNMKWENRREFRLAIMTVVSDEQACDIATALTMKCVDYAQALPASSEMSRAFHVLVPFLRSLASAAMNEKMGAMKAVAALVESAGMIGRNATEGCFFVKIALTTLMRLSSDYTVFRAVYMRGGKKKDIPFLHVACDCLGRFLILEDD